ncbi:MAG: TIGR02450 family Trp-rich protein [Kofleriaceae bacterium]
MPPAGVDGPDDRERHFEVVAVQPRSLGELVTLRSILTGRERRVSLRALADPRGWRPGWHALAQLSSA